MGWLSRLFGMEGAGQKDGPRKQQSKMPVPAVDPPDASYPRLNSEEALRSFASRACQSRSALVIQLREVFDLRYALAKALQAQHPNYSLVEATNDATRRLTLTCPRCGPLSEQVIISLCAYPPDQFSGKQVTFGGPGGSVAGRLAQGRCPGCEHDTVEASFAPS